MYHQNITNARRCIFPALFCALGGLFVSACSLDSTAELTERATNSVQDRTLYDANKPTDIQEVTLQQAIAIAQRYNTDLWLARQDEAIRREVKTASFLKMLPTLSFDVNAETRDSYNASQSVGLFTGEDAQLSSYSYSAEKSHTYGGMKVLWNALDFGVSYYRARQELNREKQAGQEKRRVMQKLAADVATAYWQCRGAEKTAQRAQVLQKYIDTELQNLQESVKSGRAGETDALERSYLLKSQRVKVGDFLERAQGARLSLMQLMGMPVDSRFTLADLPEESFTGSTSYNVDELENKALVQRPEFFQEDLSEKISRDEARAALLSALPSPSLFANPQADNNKYLYYNTWFTAGVNVSWNLFSIPGKVVEAKTGMKRMEFTRKKRMALAVAVITQVRLAVIEHDFAVERCRMLQDLNADSQKITDNLEQAAKAGKAKANAAVTQMARGLDDYARYQDACARVMIAKAHIAQSTGSEPDLGSHSPEQYPAPAYGHTNAPRLHEAVFTSTPTAAPQPRTQPAIAPEEAAPGTIYIVGPDGTLIPKQTNEPYIEIETTPTPQPATPTAPEAPAGQPQTETAPASSALPTRATPTEGPTIERAAPVASAASATVAPDQPSESPNSLLAGTQPDATGH